MRFRIPLNDAVKRFKIKAPRSVRREAYIEYAAAPAR